MMRAALLCLAFQAYGQTVLTDNGLKLMLQNLGYEPKVEPGTSTFIYTIQQPSGRYSVPIQVSLAPNKARVWLACALTVIGDDVEVRNCPLLGLLEQTYNFGPAFFSYSQPENRFYLNLALDNRNISPATMRWAINHASEAVASTAEFWDGKRCSASPPVSGRRPGATATPSMAANLGFFIQQWISDYEDIAGASTTAVKDASSTMVSATAILAGIRLSPDPRTASKTLPADPARRTDAIAKVAGDWDLQARYVISTDPLTYSAYLLGMQAGRAVLMSTRLGRAEDLGVQSQFPFFVQSAREAFRQIAVLCGADSALSRHMSAKSCEDARDLSDELHSGRRTLQWKTLAPLIGLWFLKAQKELEGAAAR
jgi:hypothetical protein